MEIREYLEIVRRHLWVPVALPLCAALIVVVTTLLGPREYTVTATVAAGAFTSGDASLYTGPSAHRAFVGDVLAVLETQAVVANIAEASRVSPPAIRQGLRATPIGEGGLVQIVYRSAQPSQAQQVARQAVKEATALLFQPPRELAQVQIDMARQAIADVDAEIDGFVAATGLALPDLVYERRAEQLADLQLREAQGEAGGQDAAATRLRTAMDVQRAELAKLAPQVRVFTALQDRRDEAVDRLAAATRAVAELDALLHTVGAGGIVTVGEPVPIAKMPIVMQKGAAAVGAGLFLGVALTVLLESLDRRRPAAEETPATDSQEPSEPTGDDDVPLDPEAPEQPAEHVHTG